MEAMDFQKAAAERILDLFRNKQQNRVLLADEVGLGKTIIASEVVEGLKEEYAKAGKIFTMVYVCSNLNIAAQNCRKLGIPEENCLPFSESRLSMQHLMMRKREVKQQQLIPMTPATSLSMTGGQGIQQERALIYAVLENHPVYRVYRRRLNRLLKYDPRLKNWDHYTEEMKKDLKKEAKKDRDYLPGLYKEFDELLKKDQKLTEDLAFLCQKVHPEKESFGFRAEVINGLRRIFAQISLRSLHPDLVIMDEFQRFKDLLETEGNFSEQRLLASHFLNDADTKVLLLSATPYKPFTTMEEYETGEEDHNTEFQRVMDFLYTDAESRRRFADTWGKYSGHLKDLRGENREVLIEAKQDAEDKMYRVICRTERRNGSIFDTAKAKEVSGLLPGDVTSFIDIQRLMDGLGLGKFPVGYQKSAPYLMSFMKYKVWEKIVKGIRQNPDILGKSKDMLFLKRGDIDRYRKIPCNNARLETLFEEVFEKGRNRAEYLLWIPASKPYYTAARTKAGRIYARNAGYSKLLVFSSWEMVPRVIAALTSYEAERRVYEKLPPEKAMRYFAEEEGDERRSRRKGTHRRISTGNLEICETPCKALAGLYDPVVYMGQPLGIIRADIRRKVKELLEGIRKEGFTKTVPKSAENIRSLLWKLDGEESSEKKFEGIPKGIEGLLTDMAIGAPANCAFRLFRATTGEEDAFKYAKNVAGLFVSLFNKPESAGVLQTLYGGTGAYYEQVFRYCVEGNLQAVLDEYAYVLSESGEALANAMKGGVVNTASILADTEGTVKGWSDQGIRLRTHFAVGYYNARISEKAVQRTENVRRAFNSPFRPFVLATTSIGQEGLDFHYYARKIMHWNLPSNPIEIEQREGRINRYLCLAIRQNLAESECGKSGFEEGTPVWDTILENARKLKGEHSDLVPFWCLPDEFPYTRKIERIVPMYPYSSDRMKYERLIQILALYRLTLGQPRQEELIDSIQNEKLSAGELEKLYMNLSPWQRERGGVL